VSDEASELGRPVAEGDAGKRPALKWRPVASRNGAIDLVPANAFDWILSRYGSTRDDLDGDLGALVEPDPWAHDDFIYIATDEDLVGRRDGWRFDRGEDGPVS
jgi:hypothetical protein